MKSLWRSTSSFFSWWWVVVVVAVLYLVLVFGTLVRSKLPHAFDLSSVGALFRRLGSSVGQEGLESGSRSGSGSGSGSNACANAEYQDTLNLPLREYVVQASFNSAYDYGDVSADTLGKRIAEGYRFLDLNVFSASGGELYVGFSRDNAPVMTSVKLSFAEAIETIKSKAFVKPPASSSSESSSSSTPGVPTLADTYYKYPMFVHLRVYRPPESNEDVVQKIAKMLEKDDDLYLRAGGSSGDKKRPVPVTGCTPLAALNKKLIFSMDIENLRQIYAPANTPSIEFVPQATREALRSFVNVMSGGHTLLSFYRYDDASLLSRTHKLRVENALDPNSKQKYKTNAQHWSVVYPHPTDNNANPDTAKLMLDSTIQLTPVRVYIKDEQLGKYTKMFESLKTPFVPLSFAHTYWTNR